MSTRSTARSAAPSRTAATVSSAMVSIRRARGSRASPAGVSATRRVSRTKSGCPSSFSNCLIEDDNAC